MQNDSATISINFVRRLGKLLITKIYFYRLKSYQIIDVIDLEVLEFDKIDKMMLPSV